MKTDIMKDILDELKRAERKFPNWPDHAAAQAGIVCEEAGELMQACLQYKYERGQCDIDEHVRRMRREAVQTAAMAIRFLKNMPAPAPQVASIDHQ